MFQGNIYLEFIGVSSIATNVLWGLGSFNLPGSLQRIRIVQF